MLRLLRRHHLSTQVLALFLCVSQPWLSVPQSVLYAQTTAQQPRQARKYLVPLPDSFKEDWTPPKPVLTPKEIALNKAIKTASPKLELPRGRALSEAEAKSIPVLGTPIRSLGGRATSEAERLELGQQLIDHMANGGRKDYRSATKLKNHVSRHPDSPYSTSLLIEAGEIEWCNGFFLDALGTFQRAWDAGKDHTQSDDRRLVEMALARLLERRGQLGQKEELRSLVASIKERRLGGHAYDAMLRAKEALWFLDNRAEHNVFCGFNAANAVCVPRGDRPIFPDVHDEEEKRTFIRDGLSAFELAAHSHESGGTLRVVRRTGKQAKIVVPSVIHWTFNHYSAITEEANGRYRIKDEGMRFDSWVPKAAIEAQTSGVFLVPSSVSLPTGYSTVSDAEAKTIFGRHCIHQRDLEGTMSKNCEKCCQGMAVYQFDLMNPGLFIKDMPISHVPPYGPAVQFIASYSQRSSELNDLEDTGIGNLGPRWTHSFKEVLALKGTSSSEIRWIQSDASHFDYTYNSPTQTYNQKYRERPILNHLVNAEQGGPGYELRFPDGSRKIFKLAYPNANSPTQYLLTHIVDALGQTVTLGYDNFRLSSIEDALGQVTTLSYEPEVGDNVSSDTSKIRKITDPFSRVAKFKYDAEGRLEKIIDPVLIESKFHYANGDFIDRLTTPYGTTEFMHGDTSGINGEPGRFIESVDANGDRERVEANDFALPDGEITFPEYTESPLPTDSGTGLPNDFYPRVENMHYRNTFVWDKKQMFYHPRDYSKARIYNWLASGDEITNSIASIKDPLEGRIWFNYPEQNSEHAPGQMNIPSKVVRAVENPAGGHTWIMLQASYNSLGLPTGTVDAEGREQRFVYKAPGNSVLEKVEVKNGANWETILTINQFDTVFPQLPKVMTDASGIQTTLTYNSKGQTSSVSISKGGNTETTRLIYDQAEVAPAVGTYGYLLEVQHTSASNPGQFVTLETRLLDAAKRVRTVTDAQGYTLTFDYDALDRVTVVTHPDATNEQLVYNDGAKPTLDVWASKDRSGHWTRTRYNHLRQPVMQLDSLARLTQWEWCKCGSLSKLIDAQNKVTSWKRDIQGRVIEKILPDGKKYAITYQPLSGRPKDAAYPQDAATASTTFSYEYFPGGQLKKLNYTSATLTDITYGQADYLGRPTTVTDSIGTTTSTYVPLTGTPNAAGQTDSINGPMANDTIRYSYDWKGRSIKQEIVADDGVTVSRTQEIAGFDSLGRITGLSNNLGTFTPTYNAANLTSIPDSTALPGGFSSIYERYPAGAGAKALKLEGIEHRSGSDLVQKHAYDYDDKTGLLKSWTRTNAASVATAWSLRHDTTGQITDLDETIGGTATQKSSWHYDTAGNIASTLIHPVGQSALLRMRQHTGRNQLTSIGGAGKTMVEGTIDEPATVTVNSQPAAVTKLSPGGPWRFQREVEFPDGETNIEIVATDGSNNQTTQNYTVTVDDSAGAQSLEYDDNGNLTKITDTLTGTVTRVCEWDALNQLLAIQSAQTPAAGVKRSEFTYDGGGRRVRQIEKEHNGTAWVTLSDWRYTWIGLELAQKRDTSTNALLVNYFGSGEQQGSDALVYLPDHLGTPRSWYRVSDGLRGEADYTVHGERTVTTAGPGVPERSFTGHLSHAASGLVLAPFRAYDPGLGRWISEDPIGEAGGLNLYGYVGNHPAGLVDPTGEFAFIPVLLAAWAVAEVALALWDTYDTIKTIADPCESTASKMAAAGLWIAGAFLPGGGYSQVDNLAKAGLRRAPAANRGYISGSYSELRAKALAARGGDVGAMGEIEAAKLLRSEGTNVHFQTPIGPRGPNTADFLVGGQKGTGLGGAPTDVFTPITSKPGNIISGIANKNNQAPNIIVNLQHTPVTGSQLGNVLDRLHNGFGATNIQSVRIIE